MSKQQTQSKKRPWGLVAATLMGAMVTLIGVARGVDPLLILQRVAVAAFVTGIVVSWTAHVMSVLAPTRHYNASRGRS